MEGPGVDDTFDSSKPAPKETKPSQQAPKSSDPLKGARGVMKPPSLEELMRPLVGTR